VNLTTHYYVLSLGGHTSRLYEAFRDTLIDILNKGFPIESSALAGDAGEPVLEEDRLLEFIRTADRHFDHYLRQDPLRLVVVGEGRYLSLFRSVTSHQDVLIGMVEGDYTGTSPHDLGKIVWPIVKDAMAGTGEKAIRDLETAENSRSVASGIDSVGHAAGSGTGGTLFVEEDLHIKGGIREEDHSLVKSEDLDIREAIDDAVDAIIEKVLKKGGNVIFLESGSLTKLQRIALVTGG
jgi:hypothetical protein